jgi:type II secretory pathway component GspD/PulD (secretin)
MFDVKEETMTSTTLRPMALATALGLLTILGVESAPGQQNKGSPEVKKNSASKAPTASQAKEPEANHDTQLKVIKLSNAKPEEVRDTLTIIWSPLMNSRGIPASMMATGVPVAVNERTKTLFVRGTEKQLEIIENLIQVLDIAPGQDLPKADGLNVVRLRHAKVDQVFQVLAGLGLQQHVIP